MSDLRALSGAARPVIILGEPYAIYPLTIGDLGEMQGWLDSQLPDPLAIAQAHIAKGGVPMEQAKYLLGEALREASRTRVFLSSVEARPYLNSPAGILQLLWRAIRKGRPGWTVDDARQLVDALTPSDIERIQKLAEIDQVVPEADDPIQKAAGTTPAEPAAA